MDPLQGALTLAKTAEKAEGFLKEILGPPAKEMGELWKDKVSARRFRNLIKIVAHAKEQLEEAGVSPKEVPLKIIHPLLESASLEEDQELQERWASLLANSADSDSQVNVLPRYITTLRELSSLEARLLNDMYERVAGQLQKSKYGVTHVRHVALGDTIEVIKKCFTLKYRSMSPDSIPKDDPTPEVVSALENLVRLGLLRTESYPEPKPDNPICYFTTFGFTFVQACNRPSKMTERSATPDGKSSR